MKFLRKVTKNSQRKFPEKILSIRPILKSERKTQTHNIIIRWMIMKLSKYLWRWWRSTSFSHGALVIHERVKKSVGWSRMMWLRQCACFGQLKCCIRTDVFRRFCSWQLKFIFVIPRRLQWRTWYFITMKGDFVNSCVVTIPLNFSFFQIFCRFLSVLLALPCEIRIN